MNFKIQILGSNSAIPNHRRFSTAQIITVHDEHFLIDCGEGTQIQMKRFATKYGKIKNIFISHLHGDHYFGLFGLLSTYNLTGRIAPLNIYAHKRLHDIFSSEFSPINISELTFEVNFIHLSEGNNIIFENKSLTVTSFNLKHSTTTWGFLFSEKQKELNIKKDVIDKYNLSYEQIRNIKKGDNLKFENNIIQNEELTFSTFLPRSYAFCSDTAYYENIINTIKNIDLLYHEATFCNEDTQRAEQVKHSTAEEAARIAKLANVSKLLIGHFSSKIINPNKCLIEAKNTFNQTLLASDGMSIDISTEHKFLIEYPET